MIDSGGRDDWADEPLDTGGASRTTLALDIPHQGHPRHRRATFAGFLASVIVIVGGLIYFPMLILEPIGERIVS